MFASNFNSLVEINVTNFIDKEYVPFFEDLIRMLLLQIVIHFMYFSRDPTNNVFFSVELFELLLYISVGISVYWLLFKKIIKLT